MKQITSILLILSLLSSFAIGQNKAKKKKPKGKKAANSQDGTLLDARAGFKTNIIRVEKSDEPMDVPPEDSAFTIVKYPAKLGAMSAYLTKKPELEDGEKVPAIIWLTGGFPSASPGSYLWEETKTNNEQSARIYRLRGVEMMFPLVRGTVKENPGQQESFYGEVEDVIAAGKYLKSLDYIDPNRVYLGGHSTGGTLALLTASSTDLFAGVISLGPNEDHYGEEKATYEWTKKEIELRSPIKHLAAIKTPTYIIEGYDIGYSVTTLGKANKNPLVKCYLINEANHFNVIHPVNSFFSKAILDSKDGKLAIDDEALKSCHVKDKQRRREAGDLEQLAEYRRKGYDLTKPQMVTFYFLSGKKGDFLAVGQDGYKGQPVTAHKNSRGQEYFVRRLKKEINLSDLNQLFKATKEMSNIAYICKVTYDDWSLE